MITRVELEYMDALTIELIAQGVAYGIKVSALRVPQGIWLNWKSPSTGISGTAQIDTEVTDGTHGAPDQAACKFMEYLDHKISCEAY